MASCCSSHHQSGGDGAHRSAAGPGSGCSSAGRRYRWQGMAADMGHCDEHDEHDDDDDFDNDDLDFKIKNDLMRKIMMHVRLCMCRLHETQWGPSHEQRSYKVHCSCALMYGTAHLPGFQGRALHRGVSRSIHRDLAGHAQLIHERCRHRETRSSMVGCWTTRTLVQFREHLNRQR